MLIEDYKESILTILKGLCMLLCCVMLTLKPVVKAVPFIVRNFAIIFSALVVTACFIVVLNMIPYL